MKKNETETKRINRKKDLPRNLRLQVARELAVTRIFEGMSQTELAEATGTQKSNISRMESGGQNMSVDYIESASKALGKEARFVLAEPEFKYGDVTDYSLKLYDEELMKFRLDKTKPESEWCQITWINEERRDLLPLDMELTGEGVVRWLDKRTVPQNRDLVGNILSSLGLSYDDLKGIIDICKGLSLNDSYWVTSCGFTGSFDEYNLYENRFDDALSLIAYTGGTYDTSKFKTSPELTTGGMLRKAWRWKSGKGIWLYKGGTEGFANAGNEPYCEFYAYQVAKAMGINAVEYELENWKGILASKCRLFTDIDTSYIPIGRIVKTGDIDACLNYYRDLGEEFYQELASMLVFDAVVLNEDRHFGNFGILRENKSGKIVRPAPVFDNGISLLCYAMKDDFNNIEEYIKERSNPYGYKHQYMDLAKEVIGPLQRKQLRRLINFQFTESDLCNLPTWRLRALEEIIQRRVKELLK